MPDRRSLSGRKHHGKVLHIGSGAGRLASNESDVALTSIKARCAQTCSVENEGTEIMTADN